MASNVNLRALRSSWVKATIHDNSDVEAPLAASCSLADPPRRGNLCYGMVTRVYLDLKTARPRSSHVKPVQVATATVWLETVTGEPC
jgi:hypothetical protein